MHFIDHREPFELIRSKQIQYNTIQILLSTPHGGFSETNINSTGNQKKKNTQELSINNIIIKKLFAYRIYDITN